MYKSLWLRVSVLSLASLLSNNLLAANGDILYQNCAAGGNCTGAGSSNGWVRTVETNACHSGSCLKLVGSLNPLPDGDVRYGAGSTSIGTGSAVAGKTEITVQYYTKLSESARTLSGGNLKTIRPYVDSNNYFAGTEIPEIGRDFYHTRIAGGTIAPTSIFLVQDTAWVSANGDGTWEILGRFLYGNFNQPGTTMGVGWNKITEWIKLPSSSGAHDAELKLWLNDELAFHIYDAYVAFTSTATTFHHFTFYPSSEAGEPFDQWMDEMIIYEGYVPPTGDDEQKNTLSIEKNGAGTGTLTSIPAGIDCGSQCRYAFDDNTNVVVTAQANGNSVFESWTGCDSVSTNTCTVSMSRARTISATFSIVSAVCDAEHYWLCTESLCMTAGFYFWDAACRTIPEPLDWVGDNLINNGEFDTWADGIPTSWTLLGGNIEQFDSAVRLFDSTTLRQPVLESGKNYRYAVNINVVNAGQLEVYHYDHSDYFSSRETVTGTFILGADLPDWSLYFGAPAGSNDVVIDSIVVRERELTCTDTANACLDQTSCTAAGWTWLDGVCADSGGGDDAGILDAGQNGDDVVRADARADDVHLADTLSIDTGQAQTDAGVGSDSFVPDGATGVDTNGPEVIGPGCGCRSANRAVYSPFYTPGLLLLWGRFRQRKTSSSLSAETEGTPLIRGKQ